MGPPARSGAELFWNRGGHQRQAAQAGLCPCLAGKAQDSLFFFFLLLSLSKSQPVLPPGWKGVPAPLGSGGDRGVRASA